LRIGEFMNTVMLSGNLVRDPELRYVSGSIAVVTVTVATSRKFTRSDGTKDEETTFVRCEAWDTAAENIAENFRKGEAVLVEGQLKNDSWEKDGVKHNSYKVRINNFAKVVRQKRMVPQAVGVVADEQSSIPHDDSGDNDSVPF